MDFIEPSFIVDKKGRVFCKTHTRYDDLIKPRDYFQDILLEKELTCLSCLHYVNNDCYFPKEEIDKIERLRMTKKDFLCRLCGKRIQIMLTVIQKLYFERKYQTKLPLICCNCHDKLKSDEFRHEFVYRLFFSILLIACGILFLGLSIFTNIMIGLPPVFMIFYIFIWIGLNYLISRKLGYFYRGIKYHEKFFGREGDEILL